MDDIKIFTKNEKELKILIQTIRIFSQAIGMKFGNECAVLIIKTRKKETTEGIELANQECIKTIREKENDKYLGILEEDTIKPMDMKGKLRRELLR